MLERLYNNMVDELLIIKAERDLLEHRMRELLNFSQCGCFWCEKVRQVLSELEEMRKK